MKYRLKELRVTLVLACMLMPLLAMAVTQSEMEQARVIAAKTYLRYANDGSGYLDDINPKTMAELEAALKTKEKENIKAFNAIPVPTDYAGWDKNKLVEYWGVTVFQNTSLTEKGRGGRNRAKSLLNKMTVAAPQPAATPAPASSAAQQTPAPNAPTPAVTPETLAADSVKLEAAKQNLAEEEEIVEDNGLREDKAYNYTWVYIMILAILVAVVVALVVYAANVFKKNGDAPTHANMPHHNDEELERLEGAVADKDVEIAMLKKKLENLSKQNSGLNAKIDELTAELESLRAAAHKPEIQAGYNQNRVEQPREVSQPQQKSRSIFLGRANSKGIFVRADRTLNVGNSVFTLETSDGFSGTFRVADSPAAWSLALSNPKEYLEAACTGYNLDDTNGASRIINESAGTAVFEGGCWRVIRKAKIRYA